MGGNCFRYDDDVVELSSKDIRPRARHLLRLDSIEEGQTIMANYNYDDPQSRGFWYDCLVSKKKGNRTQKELYATVFLGYGIHVHCVLFSDMEGCFCYFSFCSQLFIEKEYCVCALPMCLPLQRFVYFSLGEVIDVRDVYVHSELFVCMRIHRHSHP